jgi:hypothetical protein
MSPAIDWSARLAGGALAVVGALNLVLGVLSLTTDLVQLTPAVAGGLLTAGLLTAAVGALVWRGSRPATLVALTVFGILLVVRLGDLGAGGAGDAGLGAVTLAVLVVVLAIAAVRTRRGAVRSA